MEKDAISHTPRTVLAKTIGGGTIPCLTWINLEIGDFVVYETRKGRFIVLKIFQTKDIPPKLAKKAERFIVQKIDMENYRTISEEQNHEEKTS